MVKYYHLTFKIGTTSFHFPSVVLTPQLKMKVALFQNWFRGKKVQGTSA